MKRIKIPYFILLNAYGNIPAQNTGLNLEIFVKLNKLERCTEIKIGK